MAKVPLSELKARFVTGHIPTQQDFTDLFDSMVHKDDQAAVDSAVVNTAISSYDATLNTENNNGQVDTLGDLKGIMGAFDDDKPMQPVNLLKYDSDRLAASDTTTTWLPATSEDKWAVQDLLNAQMAAVGLVLNSDTVIKDIEIRRTKYTISGTTFYVDTIQSVRCLVKPQINLQPQP